MGRRLIDFGSRLAFSFQCFTSLLHGCTAEGVKFFSFLPPHLESAEEGLARLALALCGQGEFFLFRFLAAHRAELSKQLSMQLLFAGKFFRQLVGQLALIAHDVKHDASGPGKGEQAGDRHHRAKFAPSKAERHASVAQGGVTVGGEVEAVRARRESGRAE